MKVHHKYGKSTYNLDKIKSLLENEETRIITLEAQTNATMLGYISDEDIIERCKKLKETEIYKTMPAEKEKSHWQDVYRTCDQKAGGRKTELYIKLQIKYGKVGVIIQFKEK